MKKQKDIVVGMFRPHLAFTHYKCYMQSLFAYVHVSNVFGLPYASVLFSLNLYQMTIRIQNVRLVVGTADLSFSRSPLLSKAATLSNRHSGNNPVNDVAQNNNPLFAKVTRNTILVVPYHT